MSDRIAIFFSYASGLLILLLAYGSGANAHETGTDCPASFKSCQSASYALGVILASEMPAESRPFDGQEIISGFNSVREGRELSNKEKDAKVNDAIKKLEYYLNSPNGDEQKIIDEFLSQYNLTVKELDALKYSSYEVPARATGQDNGVSEYIDEARNKISLDSQAGMFAIDTMEKALLPIKDRHIVDDMNDEVTVSYRRVKLKTGEIPSNGKDCIFSCDSANDPMLVPDNWTTKRFPLMGVIQGWREGMRGMREGDLRRLEIRPSKAYGNKEIKGVKVGETLIYELYLHQVH